jgi:DNA replication protein DnaC
MTWNQFCSLYDIQRDYHACCIDQISNISNSENFDFLGFTNKFLKRPVSLLLQGSPGRGKTYFLFSLISALIETRGFPLHALRYFNADDLDMKINEQIREYGSASFFIKSLADADFLFIDDMGVESSREKAERNYYTILDKRLSNGKTTVLSTNLNDEEILKIFGSRIQSRLKQCVKLIFDGQDLRQPALV